jgi:hypothetical protein
MFKIGFRELDVEVEIEFHLLRRELQTFSKVVLNLLLKKNMSHYKKNSDQNGEHCSKKLTTKTIKVFKLYK